MKKIFYMHHFCAAAMAAATVLSGEYAHSEEEYAQSTVQELPESGPATLEGKVVKIKNDYMFTMKDETGSVSVLMDPYTSPRIKTGDTVVVAGSVSSGKHNTKGVVADRLVLADNQAVRTDSNGETANENARNDSNFIDMPTAGSAMQYTKINSLPNKGIVKVSGIVEAVNGKKTFVLKDSTGLITVKRKSSDNLTVKEGSSVTVVGSVDNKLFGKNIDANSISIDAAASTTGSNTGHRYPESSEE